MGGGVCGVFGGGDGGVRALPPLLLRARGRSRSRQPLAVRHWPQTQPWQQPSRARIRQALPAHRPAELRTAGHDDLGRLPAVPARTGPTRPRRASRTSRARSCWSTTRTSRSWSPSRELHDLRQPVRRPRHPARPGAAFYRDFLNKPGDAQPRPHHPRVLDGGLRRPVRRRPDRLRRLPDAGQELRVRHGDRFQGGTGCPAGDTCGRDLRTDARAAWIADVGEEVAAQFDFVFFLSAGQDESSTWQEFGQMKFPTKEDVTDDFGPAGPGAAELGQDPLRRLDLLAGVGDIWPNAAGGSLHAGRELGHVRLRPRVQPHPRASATTTTTRTRSRRAGTTPGRGRCSAGAPSTAPAVRTAAG